MKGRDIARWGLVAVLLLGFLFSHSLATVVTDLWWFDEVGYAQVFWTLLKAQWLLGGLMAGLFLMATGLTCWWILRQRSRMTMRNAQVLEFRRTANLPRALPYVLTLGLSAFSLIVGLEASGHAQEFLNFWHAHSFGKVDPLYGLDIGFYVFRLPLLSYLYERLFFILFVCAILALALHFAVRSIQVIPDQFVVAPAARSHLLGLAGTALFLKAFGFVLDTFELLTSAHAAPVQVGASYTDVHIRLPVLYLSAVLCVACAVTTWVNRNPKHWRTTVALLSVLVLVSFSGDVLMPVLAQRFVVEPNKLEKEREYIQRHIDFTRAAYDLEAIQVNSFPADATTSASLLEQNRPTIDNIPLWDHTILGQTLKQMQAIRSYYDFKSVDNDRYTIEGRYRQVILAPRELSAESLPGKGWINEHVTYTHGYGVCMVTATESDHGMPVFVVKDIPPKGPDTLKIDKPQIYYGEMVNKDTDYCFVDTSQDEFDHPTNDQANGGSAYTHYTGQGGVELRAWQKWLYFLRFGETNVLLNTNIRDGSRVMYHRNIQDRVAQVTPWVAYDKDAYLVVSNGQLYWILDGYTSSGSYPYSSTFNQDGGVNYLRNSVKAVVNAYDGKMQFYIADRKDPIVQTYADVFPGLFLPLDAMPPDLQAHLRYPMEYFRIQSNIYATFHMQDSTNFFGAQDQWQISPQTENRPVDPYYTVLKLKDKEEFVLMLPFSPANKQNMVAWMAARCDGANYGQLVVYEFPHQKNIYGPSQIYSQLNQNADISKSLTLWNQKGSQVQWGTLLVVPVGDSILYVQPVYLAATESKTMPQLIAVIVSDGDHLAMGSTLSESLAHMIAQGPATAVQPAPTPTATPAPTGTSDLTKMDWKALVQDANTHMNEAEAAQRNGDWARYGQELKQLKAELEEMSRRGEPH